MPILFNDETGQLRGQRNRVSEFLLLACFLSAVSSCSQAEETPLPTVGDSLGIRVVHFLVSASPEPLVMSSTDMVEIAGSEDDPIAHARGLIFWNDERIVLADSDLSLRVYSLAGERVDQFGGRGEGPGEFMDILFLSRGPSGELSVLDPRRLRVSVFDGRGAFVRSVSIFPGPAGSVIDPRAILGTSGVVALSLPTVRRVSERNPHGHWGYSSVYARADTTGAWNSIASIPVTQCSEQHVNRCIPKTNTFSGMVRSTDKTIVVTPADWPEIQVYDPSGALLDLIRIGEPADGGFTRLVVGQDGVFWVSRAGDDTWTVADTRSMKLRRIIFPQGFGLHDIRDRMALGTSVDSLGVQKAVLIRLPGT
jgi:hypothetical protein